MQLRVKSECNVEICNVEWSVHYQTEDFILGYLDFVQVGFFGGYQYLYAVCPPY